MSWPLPLARDALRQAAKNPVPQPMPTAAKRAAEEAKLPVGLQGPVRLRIVATLLIPHMTLSDSWHITAWHDKR